MRRRLGWALCGVTVLEYAGVVVLGGIHSVASAAGAFIAIASCAIVGALILHRDPGHRIGWILCAAPLLIGLSGVTTGYADVTDGHGAGRTAAAWVSQWSWMAGLGLPVTFLGLLVPDGRLPSRRWRPFLWLACAQYSLLVVGAALAPGVLDKKWGIDNPVGVRYAQFLLAGGLIAVPPVLPAGIAAAVVRFRRGSVVERQQLKWIEAIIWLTWSTIPIAFGVAILRYRLYEIDVIIRRTLVYAALVAILATLYLGGVASLGWAFRSATGQSSALAVTLSTLAVAAAFQPVRRRVQAGVDRRFYRSAYDAGSAVAAFTGRLREEIDLDALRGELLETIADTVQPTHAGVWLRPAPEEV
jgi:hypothetical protein